MSKSSVLEGVGDEVVIFSVGIFLVCLVFCLIDIRHVLHRWLQVLRAWIGIGIMVGGQAQDVPLPVRPYNGGNCPICLQNTTLGLETNCGHVFCGRCLIHYWHQGNFGIGAMKCALCRQSVTMMFAVFTEEEYAAEHTSTLGLRRQELLQEMNQYNRAFSGMPRTIWQMIRDSPVLVRHLLNDLISDRGIMRMFQLRIVICVLGGALYVFCPLDMLPEALFGLIGFIDDVLVLLLIFIYLSTIYHRIMIARANAVGDTDSEED